MPEPDDRLLPQTARALLHRLATGQADGRAPAMSAAVVRDGHQVWTDSRGSVDGAEPTSDTQYRIGSLTKTFTALLVLRLRDEGRLDLVDRLDTHLPGTAAGDRTIAQLLAHTSGLVAETAGQWWERTDGSLRPTIAAAVPDRPTPHPAGRVFHYSNLGYGLLGALIERLRGEPWDQVLRREVLDPLGMTRTTRLPEAPHAVGWAVHPWADVLLSEPLTDTGALAPAGQLWSTADDLCRWAAFLGNGDERVLSAASLAEMRTAAGPPQGDLLETGYGFGLQVARIGGRLLVGHGGSMPGFLAMIWVSVDERLGAVALANATDGPLLNGLTADLVRIVAEHEPSIPAAWRPLPAVDQDLLALTGPWYWGPTCLALRLSADRGLELVAVGGRGRQARFAPAGTDTWVGLDGYYTGETLRVVRDAAGAVTHLDLGTFVLTRGPYHPAGPIPGGVDPAGWREG
jgi:D-alanyl-D-alanine carboxypeptidase